MLIFILTDTAFGQMLNDTVVDIDGNVYHSVKIGTQTWFVENLKVKHFNNGVILKYQHKIEDILSGDTSSFGTYSVYDNDSINIERYGLLYNWYALNDSQKLCPNGWHVPKDEEWQTLELFLGINAGGKLKDTSSIFWETPNSGATNGVGFKALGCGYRDGGGGIYSGVGKVCYFWSSSENNLHDLDGTWVRELEYNNSNIGKYNYSKSFGFSVRCIKDN